jgi:hypothetical protein
VEDQMEEELDLMGLHVLLHFLLVHPSRIGRGLTVWSRNDGRSSQDTWL